MVTIASAQIKSALLLAALGAHGRTRLSGALATRDHTERLFTAFGVPCGRADDSLLVDGPLVPRACDLDVPGDFSSAAFLLAAAASVPGGRVVLDDVGLNPTRTAFLDVLRRFGAELEIEPGAAQAEPRGRIRLTGAPLRAVTIEPHEVPGLIDELPLVGVLGLFAQGTTVVRGASELRVKESDRIETFAAAARALGGEVETAPDGFAVRGPARLHGGAIVTAGDHRIAMAFAVAARSAGRGAGAGRPGLRGGLVPRLRPRAGGAGVSELRAAVIGHPVAHSRSPELFAKFAAAHGIALRYEAVDVAPAELAATLAAWKHEPDFVGCNVTLPHKERALALADEVEPAARDCGAANVLTRIGGALVATNTDVSGVEQALARHGVALQGARVVVLGAGGAARAVAAAARRSGAASLTVAARVTARAAALAADFGGTACTFEDVPVADVYVNATPLGMVGQPQDSLLPANAPRGAVALDLVYTPAVTPFLIDAGARGLRMVPGTAMFFAQAAATFARWFGIEPRESLA